MQVRVTVLIVPNRLHIDATVLIAMGNPQQYGVLQYADTAEPRPRYSSLTQELSFCNSWTACAWLSFPYRPTS